MRAIHCQPPPKFERGNKAQNSTETALFYTVCYGFVLLIRLLNLILIYMTFEFRLKDETLVHTMYNVHENPFNGNYNNYSGDIIMFLKKDIKPIRLLQYGLVKSQNNLEIEIIRNGKKVRYDDDEYIIRYYCEFVS